jgi:hypothetical protein
MMLVTRCHLLMTGHRLRQAGGGLEQLGIGQHDQQQAEQPGQDLTVAALRHCVVESLHDC